MTPFFPESPFTGTRVDSLLSRLPRSLIPMALVTGIVVHSYHAFVLASPYIKFGWVTTFLAFAGEYVLLLSLATVYLGNHPVRQWLWRAPLFTVIEWMVEAVFVAIFIFAKSEHIGSEHARQSDWASLVVSTLVWHGSAILVFSLILGVVVQTVRFALLKHERRDSTAIKIHEEREMEKAEELLEAQQERGERR